MIRPPAPMQGPLDQYSAMLTLRNMADQNALHGLQRQKLEGDLAEEAAFKSRIADWANKGGEGPLPPEAIAASPSRAIALEKNRLEGEKTRGEIDYKKIQTLSEQSKYMRDRLAGVTDQPSYDAVLAEGRQLGQKWVDTMPPQWGPDAQAKLRQHAMDAGKFIEQTTPKFEFKSDGPSDRLWQTNPLGGKLGPVEGAPVITKKMTPAERDASARGWAQLGQPVWDEQRGVWVMRPAQSPSAAPVSAPAAAPAAAPNAAPAAPAAPAVVKPAGLPPKTSDVQTLRHEFNQLPEVKAYRDVIPIVEAARSAPDTRAGDIQLGYAVGKILDPASVVREGEIKLAGDAATMMQKYMGELRTVTEGKGRMTPQTRADLMQMLDNAVGQRHEAYQRAEGTYKGIAEKSGIPVDQVIISTPTGVPKAPTGPKMFDAPPDPSQYKGKRLQADDGTIYVSDGAKWVRQAKAAQ